VRGIETYRQPPRRSVFPKRQLTRSFTHPFCCTINDRQRNLRIPGQPSLRMEFPQCAFRSVVRKAKGKVLSRCRSLKFVKTGSSFAAGGPSFEFERVGGPVRLSDHVRLQALALYYTGFGRPNAPVDCSVISITLWLTFQQRSCTLHSIVSLNKLRVLLCYQSTIL
jgi:hypothetical protein